MRHRIRRSFLAMALVGVMTLSVFAQRTVLKPLESGPPDPDIKVGREAVPEIEKELSLLKNSEAEAYLDALGKRLASKALGEKFPYSFKIVNDKEINAFALPGGFIYINRGIFESAKNESQLAGVIGHEIGHVAMRHGMNQMKKANLIGGIAGVGGAILGGLFGGKTGDLAQAGTGLLATSVLLRYSRDAETQSDLIGAQLLYDNGYDPIGMVDFFEILDQDSKGGRTPQFFSNHPNPDNRIVKVKAEIVKLGGAPASARKDSSEFQRIKQIVSNAPVAPAKGKTTSQPAPQPTGRPDRPSTRVVQKTFKDVSFQYPDNWRPSENDKSVAVVPDRGIVSNAVAYGMIVQVFQPRPGRNGQYTVEDATDQLIAELRQANPNMRVTKNRSTTRIGNQNGLTTMLTNDSPVGGQETDGVATVLRPGGILYVFIAVAPKNEFGDYQKTFNSVIASARFR